MPFLLVAPVLAAAPIVYAARNWEDGRKSILVQAFCLFVALVLTALLARGLSGSRKLPVRQSFAWGFAGLILFAAGLRYSLLETLPFPTQPGFEELQMGYGGYRLLQTGQLPVEFRYTTILAALGLLRGGDALDSLRFPYRLAGLLGLVFLVLCMRALRVGWLPAALVTVIAATLRWLVIAGGVADESFSGVALSLALLWLLIRSDRSRTHSAVWAAAAGILAGMLFCEYISFRIFILLAVGWLSWKALPRREWATTPHRWLPLVCFLLIFLVVAAPALVNLAHVGLRQDLWEGVRRHARSRPGLFAPDALENIRGYSFALAGLPVEYPECIAPLGQPLIPLPIGLLFVVSALAGLFRPRCPIVRAFCLTLAAMILVAGGLANSMSPQRMSAALPLLLVVVGAFLGDVHRGSCRLVRSRMKRMTPGWRRRATGLLYLCAALLAVIGNFRSTRFMAHNQYARECWLLQGEDYPVLRYIDLASRPGQRVVVCSPGSSGLDFSAGEQAYWVYARRHPRITGLNRFPSSQQVPPGTLVVVTYPHQPVPEVDIRTLLDLAAPSDSASSLRFYRDLAGRNSVASVCIQCRGIP